MRIMQPMNLGSGEVNIKGVKSKLRRGVYPAIHSMHQQRTKYIVFGRDMLQSLIYAVTASLISL